MKHGCTVLWLVAALALAAPAGAQSPMTPVRPMTTPDPRPGGGVPADAAPPHAAGKPADSPAAESDAAGVASIEPPPAAASQTAANSRDLAPATGKPLAGSEASPASTGRTDKTPSDATSQQASAEPASVETEQRPKQPERVQPHHAMRQTYRYVRRYYSGGWGGYDRGAAFGGPAPYSNAGN